MKNLLENEQSRFISTKKRNYMCFKYFLDYPSRIIEYFNKKFFPEPITTSTSLMVSIIASHSNQTAAENKMTKKRLEKKLVGSLVSKTAMPPEENSDTSSMLASFPVRTFMFQFLAPVGFVVIIFLLFVMSQKFFEYRNEYIYANP